MVTTEWVITEVGDAMSAPGNRRLFEEFLAALTANPDITVLWSSQALFRRGLGLYSSHKDKDWPLTDCLSFVVMREMHIKDALTADRHFEQAGFRALLK